MSKDIVPGLIDKLVAEFTEKYKKSIVIKTTLAKVKSGTATYEDAYKYSVEVGNIRAKTFKRLSSADFPDGKMYFNIADRILNDTLGENHRLVSNYAAKVQTFSNTDAGIKVATKKASLNKDRIKGIVDRVSYEDDFDDIAWILGEPVVNFTMSVVDDTVKANADFHNELGFKGEIIRTTSSDCCSWCTDLEGVYEVGSEPREIYQRHDRCRCEVSYRGKALSSYTSSQGKNKYIQIKTALP